MPVKLTVPDDWHPSIVTERWLRNLVGEGLLRPATSPTWPEWIAPPVEHQLSPPEGYMVSLSNSTTTGSDLSRAAS